MTPITERAPAPRFQGTSYDGRNIDLEEYKGRSNVLLVLMRGLG